MNMSIFISTLSVFAFFAWLGAMGTGAKPAVVWGLFVFLALTTSLAAAAA